MEISDKRINFLHAEMISIKPRIEEYLSSNPTEKSVRVTWTFYCYNRLYSLYAYREDVDIVLVLKVDNNKITSDYCHSVEDAIDNICEKYRHMEEADLNEEEKEVIYKHINVLIKISETCKLFEDNGDLSYSFNFDNVINQLSIHMNLYYDKLLSSQIAIIRIRLDRADASIVLDKEGFKNNFINPYPSIEDLKAFMSDKA